jgi:hypothetical protein
LETTTTTPDINTEIIENTIIPETTPLSTTSSIISTAST